jgi:hypothetical protein
MRCQDSTSPLLRRSLLIVAAAAVLLAGGLIVRGFAGDSPARADPGGALSFQPVLGLPSHEIQMIGASPAEAAGEVWAQANIGAVPVSVGGQQIANATVLLRHAGEGAGGWQVVPIANAEGEQFGFAPVADRVTPEGGIVLLGSDGSGQRSVVVRNPGGAFVAAAPPASSSIQPKPPRRWSRRSCKTVGPTRWWRRRAAAANRTCCATTERSGRASRSAAS